MKLQNQLFACIGVLILMALVADVQQSKKLADPTPINVEELAEQHELEQVDETEEQEQEAEQAYEQVDEQTYQPTTYYTMTEDEAKEWIAQRESGGNYEAVNGRYYGRYQLDVNYLNGDLSPENQEATADAYVANRYGSWSAAYEHWINYGWY